MTITKLNRKILFLIEFLSCVFGGVSTFIVTIITILLAREKKQKSVAKKIAYIPFAALILSSIINRFIGNTPLNKIIVFYIVFAIATIILIFIQKRLFETNIEKNSVEKRKFNIVPVILIGIVLLLITIFVLSILLFAKSTEIEDTNGIDDYSLQTIVDSDIKNINVTVSESFSNFSTNGGKSGAIMYKETDFDEIHYSAESFSGIKVLQATRLADEQYNLIVENNVVSGNCKIVIVVNGEYYSVVKLNSTIEIPLTNIQNQEAYVVVAGESSKLDVKITRHSNQGTVL